MLFLGWRTHLIRTGALARVAFALIALLLVSEREARAVDWADATAHDKGCMGINHIFDVQCEHPNGGWSHDCPDMPRRQFRGSAMTTDPVRLPDRAWTRVAIADATCGVDWADARASDKGCREAARVFHVQCERPDGSWSHDCDDMPMRQFRGSKMITTPVRLQDRAWTEVTIADAECSAYQNSAKKQCHDACDNNPVAQSLAGAELSEGGQAAIVILGCHAACELAKLPDNATLRWNESLAVVKDCTGVNRNHHIPCTDADGTWAWDDSKCPPLPTTFRGQKLVKPADNLRGGSGPFEWEGRTWMWKTVTVPDDSCKMDWVDATAHDKGCIGINHIFDVQCERPDTSWSHDCPDMPRRQFRGSAMTTDPVRLQDRAWTRVAVADATCSVDWADATASDKGCRGTAHIFHVQCERPDGGWSHDCDDMPKRLFRGSTMPTAPFRLPDRAWTEVAISDATCDPGSVVKETTERDPTVEREAVNNPPRWADATASDKGCREASHIFHVQCERPNGGWSTECSDMPTRQFRGSEMTTTPVRLPDRAWTEVAISDATCDPGSVVKETTDVDRTAEKRKRPQRSETAAAPAQSQSPPVVCDAEKVTLCKTLLQGQVPWSMRSEPQYRRWEERNMDNLCRCTQDAAKTVLCFQNELYASRDSWPKAIEACRAR